MDIDVPTDLKLTTITEVGGIHRIETKTMLVDVAVIAPVCPKSDERAAVHMVAVVDTSGSMSGAKINLVQDSLEFVLGQLQAKDKFCLVDFNSTAQVGLSLQAMSDKKPALHACDKLAARGSTNMKDGLNLGLQQLQSKSKSETGAEDSVKSVLLFTDGHPDSAAGIKESIKPNIGKISGGCTLHTFGYGSDHDGNFLQGLADEGKGSYYFLEKPDDIPNSFADVLGGLLSVVAQNITLELNPCENIKITKIHTSYQKEQQGNKWIVKIPDLFGEERKDILVECVLGSCPSACTQNVLTSSISYFNVISSSLQSSPAHLTTLERPDFLTTEHTKINVEVDEQKNRIYCTETLEEAKKSADAGNLEHAKGLLNNCLQRVQCSPSASSENTKNLVNDLQQTAQVFEKKSEYASVGQKKLQMAQQQHSKQRSQAPSPNFSSPMQYNAVKCQMQVESQQALSNLSDDRYARRAQAQGKSSPSPRHPSQMPQVQQMPQQRMQQKQQLSSRGSYPPQMQQMPQQMGQQQLPPQMFMQNQMQQIPQQMPQPFMQQVQQQAPTLRHPSQIPSQQAYIQGPNNSTTK